MFSELLFPIIIDVTGWDVYYPDQMHSIYIYRKYSFLYRCYTFLLVELLLYYICICVVHLFVWIKKNCASCTLRTSKEVGMCCCCS